MKSLSPPIPVGGGAVDTNDWCIRSDTNWAVQQQKMARGLKFRIKKLESRGLVLSM